MAIALACGTVAAGSSEPKSASRSLLPSDSLQARAACATSASPSTSKCVTPAWEALSFSGRGLTKRASYSGQSLRITVRVAAAKEEGEEPREAVSERWSLEELDKQLKTFESRETRIPRQIPSDAENRQNAVKDDQSKLQWPIFTEGFFVYAGIGLLLLTAVNNLLYKTFIGPIGVDRKKPVQTSVIERPSYRITTRQEEREAREARDANDAQRKALAAQSREAPAPIQSP